MTKAEISKLFWEKVCRTPYLHIDFQQFVDMIAECCQSFSDHLEDDGNLSEWDWSFEFVFDDGSILVFQYTSPDEDGIVESNCEVLK